MVNVVIDNVIMLMFCMRRHEPALFDLLAAMTQPNELSRNIVHLSADQSSPDS